MRRQAAVVSSALSVVLSVSGCAVVDRDLRDARACEGLSQVSSLSTVDFQEEVRSLALPHASARLGRDLWDLSRLQGELNKGQVVPSPGLVRQIEQLTTRITLRCGEVRHLITGPVPTQGLEPNLSIGSDEEQSDEAAQVPAAPDLGVSQAECFLFGSNPKIAPDMTVLALSTGLMLMVTGVTLDAQS